MISSRTRRFLTVLLYLIPGVLAEEIGGFYSCETPSWTPDSVIKITFYIDMTKYPALCTGGTTGKPEFESTTDNQNYNPECTVATDIRNDCSFSPGTLGCGCIRQGGGYYVIEYNFKAPANLHDMSWRAKIGCTDGGFIQQLRFTGSCEPPGPPPPNGGSFECESKPTGDGNLVEIKLSIDRSKFPSTCTGGTDGQPQFKYSTVDGKYEVTACTVPEDIRTSDGCAFSPGTLGCGCTSSNKDGFYIIEYNFIADAKRNYTGNIQCLEAAKSKQALSFSGQCEADPIVVCGFCEFEYGNTGDHVGCIVMICIIVYIPVLWITCIIIRIVYRCYGEKVKRCFSGPCESVPGKIDTVICCACCDTYCNRPDPATGTEMTSSNGATTRNSAG